MLEVDVQRDQGRFSLDAQFAVPGDTISVVFGPSGGGKSTLLAAIAGLKRLDKGRIALNGRVHEDASAGIRIPPHRRGFGLVFQEARLFPHLTVRKNIEYAKRRAPRRGGPDIQDVTDGFGIAMLWDRPVRHLSGGEKNRVALARALVSQPDFLLLDEPFAALDAAHRREFIGVLLTMHRTFRLPMLVVTHNIDEAAALASHIVAVREGRVACAGPIAEISATPKFSALLDGSDTGVALRAGSLRSGSPDTLQNIWLRADQVLLALQPPEAISARNIIESRISRIFAPQGDGVLVQLESPAGTILSRVTRDAALELSLAPGKSVWAIIKAHSLHYAADAPRHGAC
jgi:molybdate transport system ATP-binding protein